MSTTFILSGKGSILNSFYNPPIYLEENGGYVIGLTNFETFNNIPNIDETNNKFYYDDDDKVIEIPVGAYEVKDIMYFLQTEINQRLIFIRMSANNNTGKMIIRCSKKINFDKANSVGNILGFQNTKFIPANMTVESDSPIKITNVNSICIDCNITGGSFSNGEESHIVHEFSTTVPVGYKIVEVPQNIIYLPVTVKTITNLKVQILDQEGRIINLRDEIVTVRLHLKKL